MLFVGDDWAEDHHDVEVQDEHGRPVRTARLPEGVDGMARFHELVAGFLPDDATPSDVLVCIETDRGPWVRALPKDVRFTYVPLTTENGDALSRGYFATEALGAVERTHAALFRAMHDEGTMPMNPSDGELQGWLVGQGVPAAKLKAAWASPAMAADLRHASAFEHAVDIEGTPTLVVNGRYRITSGDHASMLRTADALIAMLRRQRR